MQRTEKAKIRPASTPSQENSGRCMKAGGRQGWNAVVFWALIAALLSLTALSCKTAARRAEGPQADERGARILFAGDTSFGENYQVRRQKAGVENILLQRGYDFPLEKLKPLLQGADLVIANLETPVTNLERSPLGGRKVPVHWSDVEKAPAAFRRHNLRVFSLANNHAMDFGPEGLEQTLRVLKQSGLESFGAGPNEREARRPWRRTVRVGRHDFALEVIGAFALIPRYDRAYSFYAKQSLPGVHALTEQNITEQIRSLKKADPHSFLVIFPHWGANYRWKSRPQTELGHRMIDAGADLVLGHGAHMLQEIERYRGRWIVYGLGNLMFNSDGRYDRYGAPPFSLAAQLVLEPGGDRLQRALRLYPIATDNRRTSFQSRPVTAREFEEVYELLTKEKATSDGLPEQVRKGQDAGGRFLELELD